MEQTKKVYPMSGCLGFIARFGPCSVSLRLAEFGVSAFATGRIWRLFINCATVILQT